MEGVIRVGTSVDCDLVEANIKVACPMASCVHNAMGCRFIQLFKFMFNVSYIILDANTTEEHIWSLLKNGTMDIYARPVALRTQILDNAYPVHALLLWRVGFILRRERKQRMLRKFYSKPFSGLVWLCLFAMTVLMPFLFLVLCYWERQLGNNRECDFVFELLLVVGGFCQFVFPVETSTLSRRTAYFTFFLFSYLVYTYYTSNLLSHLVSDKAHDMTPKDLEHTGCNFMFLEGIAEYQSKIAYLRQNASGILKQIIDAPIVNVSAGLEAVRWNKTALLSDYSLVYQEITKTFSTKEICDLIEIDLFSNMQKYLITSKKFRYKEQMKISTLRMQEAGILQRLTSTKTFSPLECWLSVEVTTSLEQISGLLLLLFCCYIVTIFILMCERVYYKIYRVFPYVD